MSYVVLARKYRPRSFAQMVGQEHVVRALSNALQQQRLHHAYLFTGTRGIGKTTVSRILAKSLNCTGPDGQGGITAEPCGVCQACTEIDADRYLDYTEMDAASNRSIDEVRELLVRAAYKPGVGRFKVFMIDEAHQLTKDAFNALLKTLEEPPEYLKFVLATTDPDKMLPTVLSRCLQFNLRPMAPVTVREHLQTVLTAEQVAFDDGALRLLARAAHGSMRDALSLTDQAIAYGGGALRLEHVRAMLGSVDRGQAAGLLRALSQHDAAAVLALVDGLRSHGFSAAGTLEELALLLQQMAVEQAVPGALDAQDPDTEDARALALLMPADETQLLYSMALHGREELGLMSDEYAALSMVLLRFLAFPSEGGGARPTAGGADRGAERGVETGVETGVESAATPPPAKEASLRASAPPALKVAAVNPPAAQQPRAELAATPAVARPEPQTALQPDPAPEPADEPLPDPGDAGDAGNAAPLADRWEALVQRLIDQGALAALVRELAWQAGLLRVDTDPPPEIWHLQVEREPLRTQMLADRLSGALSAALDRSLVVQLQPGIPADSPAQRDAARRAERQAQAERTIQQDPLVQQLLAQYPTARIVPGSIQPI